MEPILLAQDLDRRIRMEIDVLDYMIGGVLSIKYSDRK